MARRAVKIAPPAPPVVGGHPANHSGTGNHPVRRVVIHSAVTPCVPGMARRLGDWNRAGTTGGSWHYATDPIETIQCSYDRFVCWADGVNQGHIAIEMSDHPVPVPRRRALGWWRSWRWADQAHRDTLERTAALTAHLCLAYDLPVKFLSVRSLKRGEAGYTTHANVTAAFRRSTHWDPGWWPRRKFVRRVEHHAARLLEEAARA